VSVAKTIAEIAKELGIGLELGKVPNASYCHGRLGRKPAIVLGRYSDPELLLISFFHEVGHMLIEREEGPALAKLCSYPKWELERRAWLRGLWFAEQRGIHFGSQAISWAAIQLETYAGYEA